MAGAARQRSSKYSERKGHSRKEIPGKRSPGTCQDNTTQLTEVRLLLTRLEQRATQGGGWYNRRPTTLDQLRHFTRHTRKGKRHLLIVTARPGSGAAAPWRIQYPLFISFSLSLAGAWTLLFINLVYTYLPSSGDRAAPDSIYITDSRSIVFPQRITAVLFVLLCVCNRLDL